MLEAFLRRMANEIPEARPDRRGLFLRQLSDLHLARLGRIESDQVDLYVRVVGDLLRTSSLFERMAFANVVADTETAPPDLVDRLLSDVYLVARPMIERGPLSEARILTLLDEDKREITMVMIAQRLNNGIPITDRLIDVGTSKVLLAVATNTTSKLSWASFDKLGNMAVGEPEMDAALAHRADLPLDIARRLHRRVSQSSSRRVAALMANDAKRRRTGFVLRG